MRLRALPKCSHDGQILIAGAVRAEDAGAGLPPRYYNSIYVIDDRGPDHRALPTRCTSFPSVNICRSRTCCSSWGLKLGRRRHAGWFLGRQDPLATDLARRRARSTRSSATRRFSRDEIGTDARGADALLNITNDAWFGDTPGPRQHFHQAQLRAVETGLPLIRAANNGISAIVDARGVLVVGLAYNYRGVIDTILPGRLPTPTNEVIRSRIFGLCAIFLLLVAAFSRVSFNIRKN